MSEYKKFECRNCKKMVGLNLIFFDGSGCEKCRRVITGYNFKNDKVEWKKLDNVKICKNIVRHEGLELFKEVQKKELAEWIKSEVEQEEFYSDLLEKFENEQRLELIEKSINILLKESLIMQKALLKDLKNE